MTIDVPDLLGTFGDHPARAAAQNSMTAVANGDRSGWLALFDADAHVEDPVGVSPLDPTGEGHRGIEAIAAFWDSTIGPNAIRFDIERSYAAGNECANVGSITTTLPDGSGVISRGVYCYRVDDDGKILALRALWQFDSLEMV